MTDAELLEMFDRLTGCLCGPWGPEDFEAIRTLRAQLAAVTRERDEAIDMLDAAQSRAARAEAEIAEACALNCEMKELLDAACDQRDRAEKLLAGAKAILEGRINPAKLPLESDLDAALERAAELAEKEPKDD